MEGLMAAAASRARIGVIGAAVLVAACGSPASPTPSPSPTAASATPTVAPATPSPAPATPTASASPTGASGMTLGSDPSAELEPGTYRVSNPPMVLTIPEPTDDARWFGAADPQVGFFIRRATSSCDGCEPGQVVVLAVPGSVDDVVAQWTALADSSFSDVQPAELGGATGVVFEGAVPSELDVAIVHGGFNPHGLVAVYALDAGGQTVVVVVNQYAIDAPFFDDARTVVDSFVFDV